MTPSQNLTVRGPEDILGFIPHSLGYWPADSLVAMTLHGKRLGATLRLDLPGPETLADPHQYARTVRDYLRADHGADAALLVLFTNDGWMDLPRTYTGLLAALQAVLGAAGMPVRDAWYVGDLYWRDAYCTDHSCCPLPGRPIQDIRDSMLNAEMVFRGSSVGPAPEDQARPLCSVSAEDKAAILAAEAVWSVQLEPRRRSRAQFNALLAFWEGLLGSPPAEALSDPALPGLVLPDAQQAFLRASLQVPAWRDAVLVMAAAGARAALTGAEQFGIFDAGCGLAPIGPPVAGLPGSGTAAPPVSVPGDPSDVPGYGDVLLGLEPALPDWSRLHHLDRILEQLSPWGGQAGAAALTGRGWISWCRGRGSYAAAYLSKALEEEAGYRLAELMLELVRRGTLCGWAARKEAAWQKFEPDAA
ncbi:DUF4192 domain-containing protein [Arthrobacter sp. ISL-48]|uniref:DUF4192 domain-containing protein n=1 Tax=Arthrobacter sp. ISL-48 TaxID=2819110 RepID=UPI001BE54DAA|nr:DUF4192 domain-containing protein [Arthrobacter sp. ISL-48]MBT2532454.1 DUF4192 domain-containing protein [Arthrobacter sp. ISL-48]